MSVLEKYVGTTSRDCKKFDRVRVPHTSDDRGFSSQRFFAHCVTLDPELAENNWERLSVYTPAVEFQELPIRLHRSLVKALRAMQVKA
ncbi:hypothetical protein [Primorskyibacter flagellatus]|uniref:Uncharacterized protein n=1 Tax=Primorskyibacter flagellatus TaxID=1387277 RepID=A0A1W2AI42_9RHOB|nr:hypothetical protein [Primorskyibacter flagellatus]SMC60294.1 hypothetical protein SAMN06295998_10335 [Primorskyibacter flagellatus]